MPTENTLTWESELRAELAKYPPLFKTDITASVLHCSVEKVRGLLNEGKLEGFRDEAGPWLIPRAAIIKYLADHRSGPSNTTSTKTVA